MKSLAPLFYLLISLSCLSSQNSLEIVRGDGNWDPLEWEADGEFYGFHVELIREAADLVDIELSFTSYPWPRAVETIKNDNADAIMYASRSKAREEYLYFDDRNVLSSAKFIVLVSDKSEIEYNGTLSSLSGRTVGITRGFIYGRSFDVFKDTFSISESRSLELSIKQLGAGRIDAVLSTSSDILNIVKDTELMKTVRILEPPYEIDRVYIAFNKNRVASFLFERFSRSMAEVKESEFYTRLLRKFSIAE